MTAPDHRPFLAATDLRTAEDVLAWRDEAHEGAETLADALHALDTRLDRERRQAALALLPGDGDVVHIVDGAAYPAEALVWRALCGAACVAWDDGSLVPEGFDVYALGYGHDAATCAPCRAAARQP